MAITYFPYQAGAGAPVLDTQWQQMMSQIMRDGVWTLNGNTLGVTAGTGLQVLVNTGASMTNGVFMSNSASFAINLAAADPTNPRIDNIVVHADLVARTVTLIALTGTPNVSPVAPALTQNASVWEIQLNWVRVNANATVPSSFTDVRLYTPTWPNVYQSNGVALAGSVALYAVASAGSQVMGTFAPFPRTCAVAPSSITLTHVANTNLSGQGTSQLGINGFLWTYSSTAAGVCQGLDTYVTVGNSIRAVRAGAFDLHCDAAIVNKRGDIIGRQDHLLVGRSLRDDLQVLDHSGSEPGALILRHECPECGAVECFNSALSSADEARYIPGWEQRMEQAALIRQMQEQLKLPMLP